VRFYGAQNGGPFGAPPLIRHGGRRRALLGLWQPSLIKCNYDRVSGRKLGRRGERAAATAQRKRAALPPKPRWSLRRSGQVGFVYFVYERGRKILSPSQPASERMKKRDTHDQQDT
jgi:hypothetical protein